MRLKTEAGSNRDLRTRRILRWYARGILTETEALRLIGQVCLGKAPPGRGEIEAKVRGAV
jgi:hypothetical protein